jgi:hypothetical protein
MLYHYLHYDAHCCCQFPNLSTKSYSNQPTKVTNRKFLPELNDTCYEPKGSSQKNIPMGEPVHTDAIASIE